ncbi:hypothetical protein BC829DRAFT_447143 [Chytridium lagenaria]|nr:hypothetical protein BC829DRAFT_447143 [Chytridium lagenaria]
MFDKPPHTQPQQTQPTDPTLWSSHHVVAWLRSCGFSEDVVAVFQGVDGKRLFEMTEDEMGIWGWWGVRASVMAVVERCGGGAGL